MNISPVIIVKNASRTLAQTLESLKEFDEVIVYDTGSEDNTVEIARRYRNVKLCRGKFSGFGKSKNKAAVLSKNDWIFSLDADEVVSPKLMDSIRNLKLDTGYVYRIKRYNYYRNRRILYSGWQKEFVTRIYNKARVGFNEKMVHEQIEVENLKTHTLKGELRHFSYHSISDFIRKRDLYTELFVMENKGKRRSSPFLAFIRGTFDFLNTYLIRRAFLDGYRGLLISVSNADVSFYKYLKLYEANLCNDKKVSLIITTYNWKEALYLTLQSVLNQTIPPDEIIIADDGSREDTREMVENFSRNSFIPIIHSWQEDEGFRLARSRNLAISKARYEYIVIIDGDLILHKNFVADHIRNMKKGYYLQGSRVLMNNLLSNEIFERNQIKIPSIFDSQIGNRINAINSRFLSWIYSRYSIQSYQSVRGCNFSFFKEDVIKVNGFNEDFKGWGREDSEFVLRLLNSGIKRKNLKFCGIQYHLCHKIGKASSQNEDILSNAVEKKLVWCESGIDKYLDKIIHEEE